MTRFRHFERVLVRDTTETREREVAGAVGTVLGVSADEETSQVFYAVSISSLDESVMVAESDLTSTGSFEDPSEVYDGSAIRVTEGGEVQPGEDQ